MPNLYWTNEQLREAMDNFSADFKNKKYSEKIEYELWRKIRNIKTPIIWYSDKNIIVSIYEGYNRTPEDWEKVASFKIRDWGFGRFLYDNYFNEEAKKNMSSISASKLATSSATTTADVSYGSVSADSIISTGTVSDTIKINGGPISSTIDGIRVDEYGNIYWNNNSSASNTYATTISSIKADKCDICYHENKCDNCYYVRKVNENENENKNNEGEKTKMKGFNFDFGPCGNTVRLSMYGMAIQNVAGEWVSYNPDSCEIINVDVFNIADGGKYMYKMPVAISDVAIGDIVIHNRVPMFVTAINENGTFEVTDVRAGEAKTIIPTRSPFGFNFVIKIISMFNAFQSSPTPDQPFGNMLPFLMLNGEDGKSVDSDAMLMFMMMQGQTGSANMFGNPMMLYFLMKDKGNSDILPLMFMMNQSK